MGESEYVTNLRTVFDEYLELFAEKHRAYGPEPIRESGELGVAIRLCDKAIRLKNQLLAHEQGVRYGIKFTSDTEDSWLDALGYAAIGLMVRRGLWK